jgi:transposase-like protein
VYAATAIAASVGTAALYLSKNRQKKAAESVPKKLKKDNNTVDMDKFTEPVRGRNAYKEQKSKWEVEQTKGTPHGKGANWKLKDNKGNRRATLDDKGRILRE